MIITCPNCNKQFKIDNSLIPDEGRDLQCGSCNKKWFFVPEIKDIHKDIHKIIEDNKIGEKIRDGFRVSITGEVNAGKSSLLNLLAKRDVAIVSDEAGTTRDVI